MAYKELIKNFNRIRSYMREFYVYGFKKREEYTRKSPRSYDNERRRIESILGDYMQFHQTENGKNVFLSIDSRTTEHNPLYQAWKIKSFTDGDITLHYTVYEDSKIVLLTNITPDSILEEGHRSELATYKGVMISKTNAQKDMFKVNLLNALNQK